MDEALAVTVRELETEIIVDIIGDIDLRTIKMFAEPFTQAVQLAVSKASVDVFTVDLRKVGLIDHAGLQLLVEARKNLAPKGKTLQIFATSGQQPMEALRRGRFDTIMTLKCDFDEE